MSEATLSNREGGALVTGGSGGLGRATALLLAAQGSRVAITFKTNEMAAAATKKTIDDAGGQAIVIPCDVADIDSARQAVERATEELGGLHTLVHAAGPHVAQRHLSTISPATYADHLHQEAGGFFNVAQPALTPLRQAKGSVVAITTAATVRYPVRDSLSSGTKGAIEQLVRAIAVEEGRFGIRANSVGPGMLTDGMAERLIASGDLDDDALAVTRANIPLRRFGTALDVAEAVCFLASDKAAFISGQHLCVDGGYSV
jgi:NAD(P)-dependent dehydrogenase (short-subunit alcohol dehydrogenase family)